MDGWLRACAHTLAGDIGERNVFRPDALGRAASFIVEECVLGSPGADDNASGVAALLALSRRLAAAAPPRPSGSWRS